MLRSLYIGTTGMRTARERMDVITNNIVNVETTGFKKDQFVSRSFDDMLLSRLNDPNIINAYPEVGPLNTGVHVDEVATDFVKGALEMTEQTTDMALTNDGFFAVMTPDGVRYTRAGNFNVDIEGNLVTQEGYYVMSRTADRINVGNDRFSVDANGNITTEAGQLAGTVRVVQFNDLEGLRKMGDNTYTHINNEQPALVPAPGIMQGYLEASNVNVAREMADMLMTNRVYESNQRMVRMIDQSLQITVNELGKF